MDNTHKVITTKTAHGTTARSYRGVRISKGRHDFSCRLQMHFPGALLPLDSAFMIGTTLKSLTAQIDAFLAEGCEVVRGEVFTADRVAYEATR
jgi:hypothetical protein